MCVYVCVCVFVHTCMSYISNDVKTLDMHDCMQSKLIDDLSHESDVKSLKTHELSHDEVVDAWCVASYKSNDVKTMDMHDFMQ